MKIAALSAESRARSVTANPLCRINAFLMRLRLYPNSMTSAENWGLNKKKIDAPHKIVYDTPHDRR